MSADICFYFQVHQPWRLRPYRYSEVGKSHRYFDEDQNALIMRKVASKCYLPMNNLLLDLLTEFGGAFRVSFSISGTFIEQCEAYAPEVIPSFQRLFETGYVELLAETSHHSLASIHSEAEFAAQLAVHRDLATRHLVAPSRVLRNTELIASNGVASQAQALGYDGILAEGADHILQGRSSRFKYRFQGAPGVTALLKDFRLSDDIAFRFSDRNWSEWPLTVDKYARWIERAGSGGARSLIGLFMDYETFGEHQWAHTGIFEFMRALPKVLLVSDGTRFVTPSEVLAQPQQEMESADPDRSRILDVPEPYSWADQARDLTAWQGNTIQDASVKAVYELEGAVKAAADAELLETWRRLLTSDHFYYMSTKKFADGDVHRYFSPFESPYDAHIAFMNVVADLRRRLGVEEKVSA